MKSERTINCPRCQGSIDYPVAQEGKIHRCPHCGDSVWLSSLPQTASSTTPATPEHSEQAPPFAHHYSAKITWLLVLLVGAVVFWDNHRLRSELRELGQTVRSANDSGQTDQPTLAPNVRTALTQANLNQTQLDALVSEINAIEKVIETRMNHFQTRSDRDANHLESLARNVEAITEELAGLDLNITEMQTAVTELIDNYARLPAEFSAPN